MEKDAGSKRNLIRYAEADDLPVVAELCIMGLQELSGELPCKVSADKLLNSILTYWACAPCILLENNSEIVGFYGLTTYYPYYSEDAVLGDYMLYIKPKFRSYKAARALSHAARDVADKFKLVLDLNFVTPGNFQTKARFLENMGAQVIGVKAIYRGDINGR